MKVRIALALSLWITTTPVFMVSQANSTEVLMEQLDKGTDEQAVISLEKARPKIGLALSGGGARGIAHIGVLKELERLNIPVDYIAGTSFGAAVGAMYASGYSIEDLEKYAKEIDWQGSFKDDVDRRKKSFRRKQDDRIFISELSIGLDAEGTKLPAGVVTGQSIRLILRKLLSPVSYIQNFDQLAIPYRAVTTDLVTGEEVVLKEGSLVTAVAASMAIPSVMVPVENQGHLLVDGGMSNNLPISVVREMGADIVIAVDISTPYSSREQIQDVLDVTGQLTNFLTRKNTQQQIDSLTDLDILIVPDLAGNDSSDFSKIQELIDKGELAAKQTKPLVNLSLPQIFKKKQQARLTQQIDLCTEIIQQIRLVNNSGFNSDLIIKQMNVKKGDVLDISKIEADVDAIYGLGHFSTVGYQVVYEKNLPVLIITTNEKSWGPNYLQLGLSFSSSNDIDNSLSLDASYLMTHINQLNGELRSTVSIGSDNEFHIDWYQPLGFAHNIFTNPVVSWSQRQFNLFEGKQLTAEYIINSTNFDWSFGTELGSWGEFRLGSHWINGNSKLKVGDPIYDEFNFKDQLLFGQFSVDTLDNLFFPQDGFYLSTKWQWADPNWGSEFDYKQSINSLVYAFKRDENALVFGAKYNRTFDDNLPIHSKFRSGGFLNLGGYELNQLTHDNFILSYLLYSYQYKPVEFVPVYFGLAIEKGQGWDGDRQFYWRDMVNAYSVYFGADTPLGPFYLSYGKNDAGQSSFYILFDKVF